MKKGGVCLTKKEKFNENKKTFDEKDCSLKAINHHFDQNRFFEKQWDYGKSHNIPLSGTSIGLTIFLISAVN